MSSLYLHYAFIVPIAVILKHFEVVKLLLIADGSVGWRAFPILALFKSALFFLFFCLVSLLCTYVGTIGYGCADNLFLLQFLLCMYTISGQPRICEELVSPYLSVSPSGTFC